MTAPARWIIDPEASVVAIDGSSSLHPIRAGASGLRGWIEGFPNGGALSSGSEVAGSIEIDVDRLGSGNPLIDRETRRRILARRHPLITGEVVSGSVIDAGAIALEGIISFRGEQIQVEGTMAVARLDSDRIELTGSSRFDVRWWGLRLPRLGLLRVHPEIDVSVHIEAVRGDPNLTSDV